MPVGLHLVSNDHPVKPGEILSYVDAGKAGLVEQRAHFETLLAADLDHQRRARLQPALHPHRDQPVGEQSIGPTIERQMRIVVPHVGRQILDDLALHIGRI